MFTADAGGCGRGLAGGRMMVPRGKMLGGSSGINYLAYVRGHPGDFDAWASGGATGWSYDEVLPYFRKSEGLVAERRDPDRRRRARHRRPARCRGPLARAPGAQAFVDAAVAAGIPAGDYNGRDRGGPAGLVSLLQTTTRDGKRSSTYHAFLEGEVEQRAQPDDHHRRPRHPHRARGRAGRASRDRRRVRRRRRREPRRRAAGRRGRPQRRCGRVAAAAHAVGHRPARAARVASASPARSTHPRSASTSRTTSSSG